MRREDKTEKNLMMARREEGKWKTNFMMVQREKMKSNNIVDDGKER